MNSAEGETTRLAARLQEAVEEFLLVNVDHGPAFQDIAADSSTHAALMYNLDLLMLDMDEAPCALHGLPVFLDDAVLRVHAEAEWAGDWGLTSRPNQAMTYCKEFEDPLPNRGPRWRKELWCHIIPSAVLDEVPDTPLGTGVEATIALFKRALTDGRITISS